MERKRKGREVVWKKEIDKRKRERESEETPVFERYGESKRITLSIFFTHTRIYIYLSLLLSVSSFLFLLFSASEVLGSTSI